MANLWFTMNALRAPLSASASCVTMWPSLRRSAGANERSLLTHWLVQRLGADQREIELLCNQGNTIAEAARQAGITEQTYYRWRKEYGGMNSADAKRMKELEKENARLKKLVADLSLDNAILRDVNSKNF